MRFSEVYRPPRRGMGRGFLWFVAVGNAVLGSALFVVAVGLLLGPAEDRSWSVATCVGVAVGAVGWVAMSVGFHRMYLYRAPHDGRRVALETVDGAPAVVLHWRRVLLLLPLATSVYAASLAAIVCVIWYRGANPGWWIPLIVVVPVALWLPDKLIQVSRRARLVLTPKGIGADGWDGSAWLDWDDVRGVVCTQVNQWTVIRTYGEPDSPSWRWKRRPRVLFASQPPLPFVDTPGPALDVDAQRLVDAVLLYAHSPTMRAELSGEAGRRRIVG